MQRRFQPTLVASISTLVMFAVLVGLGCWQMQRLQWKVGKITEIQTQMQRPPVPLPEKISGGKWEYRRVTLAGHFLYKNEFLIKPRTMDGVNGYHMLVPFQRASGGIVFVNRGWISDANMTAAVRPAGLIQIEGIVQVPHRAQFTPENDPAKNDWYWPEPEAMAAAAKLKNVSPVIVTIAARTPGIYPAGGRVEANLPNNHQQYAIFWFTMAFVLLVIFFIRHWKAAERQV